MQRVCRQAEGQQLCDGDVTGEQGAQLAQTGLEQPGGDDGGGQPFMQGAAVFAQLQHVAQDDDATAALPHRLGAQADEARLHRQRIGVVALVDQGEGAARDVMT